MISRTTRLPAWFARHGRFPALVVGAAIASLIWLIVVSATVTSPEQARSQRAAPDLPTPVATLTEKVLRQTTWLDCRRQSQTVDVLAPAPAPGDRAVVTAVAAAGTRATTGTVLARIADRPLIAVVTDVPLYRDLTLGDDGRDVRGIEDALAAASLIAGADAVLDSGTLSAWRRLDQSGPDGTIRLDSIVQVPAGARVGAVSAAPGDLVKIGSSVMEVQAGGGTFECDAFDLPAGLTTQDVIFEVDGVKTPVAVLRQREATDQQPGSLWIQPEGDVSDSQGRVAVISADSGGPVLAAPLGAIRVAPDGDTSVVVVETSGSGEVVTEVGVSLGVTAQGLVAVTGDGLAPGTEVRLFDSGGTPGSDDLGG